MRLVGAASDECHSTSRIALGREYRVDSPIQIDSQGGFQKDVPLPDPFASSKVELIHENSRGSE